MLNLHVSWTTNFFNFILSCGVRPPPLLLLLQLWNTFPPSFLYLSFPFLSSGFHQKLVSQSESRTYVQKVFFKKECKWESWKKNKTNKTKKKTKRPCMKGRWKALSKFLLHTKNLNFKLFEYIKPNINSALNGFHKHSQIIYFHTVNIYFCCKHKKNNYSEFIFWNSYFVCFYNMFYHRLKAPIKMKILQVVTPKTTSIMFLLWKFPFFLLRTHTHTPITVAMLSN